MLSDSTTLYRGIAGVLASVVEGNFEAQGRPEWVPLAKSTIARRTKQNKGSTLKILQDIGTLASSISSDYGPDFAVIGAATAYAATHQFGATITRPAHSTKVRLRTTAKGNLSRQRKNKNLAVFAKNSDGSARESWHKVGEYTIKIPPRPYMPFRGPPGASVLQPEAETGVLELIEGMLQRAFE